jgi:uncharacterized protein (DUF697 family)
MKTMGGALDPVLNYGKMFGLSDRSVISESLRGFRLAFVGTPEACAWLRDAFLTATATPEERAEVEEHIRFFDVSPDADTTRAFAFVLYPRGPQDPIGVRSGISGVPLSGNLDQLIQGMIELRPDLAVAFSRRFRRFRPSTCQYILEKTSAENGQIAFWSSLTYIVPLPITVPFTGIANIYLLTRNQLMLIMRLAAVFGRSPGYTRQTKELFGVVGAALGWRTVARGLLSMIPKGLATPMINATIAYSGTIAVGRTAIAYYQSGQMPQPDAIVQSYTETIAEVEKSEALAGVFEAQPDTPETSEVTKEHLD